MSLDLDDNLPQKVKDEIIKFRAIYNRTGSCHRCGKCCYFYVPETGKRVACQYLSFDSEDLFICAIYDTRPKPCTNFPQARDFNETYYDDCGFNWVIK